MTTSTTSVRIEIDQVEPVLARLWEQKSPGAGVRAQTVTFIAVCTCASEVARAQEVVAKLIPVHPGRALIVHLHAEGPDGITAVEVDLIESPGRSAEPVGERVLLEVRGSTRGWVPSTIERLLLPGALVYLWWLGDIPDQDTLYDRLAEIADAIALDSANVGLGGLVKLDRLVHLAPGRFVLTDLSWVHLRWWQELLARFFDDPTVLQCLPRAYRLALASGAGRRDTDVEPISVPALLYAGWFATRMNVDVSHARWSRAGQHCWRVVTPCSDGEFIMSFESIPNAAAAPGALLRVELYTREGSKFEVARAEEDPRVLGWLGECKGVVIPHAVLKVGTPHEADLLARHLASPVRDTVFEASLSAAARMLEALYSVANVNKTNG